MVPLNGQEIWQQLTKCRTQAYLRHLTLSQTELRGYCFWHEKFGDVFLAGPNKNSIAPRVHLASSRLGRNLEANPLWFAALRTAAHFIQSNKMTLVTAPGITTHQFTERIGRHWNLPVTQLRPLPSRDADLSECLKSDTKLSGPWFYFTRQPLSDTQNRILANFALAMFADLNILLRVGRNSTTLRSIEQRIHDDDQLQVATQSTPRTRVFVHPKLTPRDITDSLLSAGAVGWWMLPTTKEGCTKEWTASPSARKRTQATGQIFPIRELDSSTFLFHWTRRRTGPWPKQSHTDFLDDLIFQRPSRNHSAFHTLQRILTSRVLFGSSRFHRSGHPMVSWTQVPLSMFPQRRIYRRHLGRWDFEPYGIAIRREYLRSRGGRPVNYGPPRTYAMLDDNQKRFFQLDRSNSGIDWRQEQEWRTPGNFDFSACGEDEAFLFVRHKNEAEQLRTLSRWPIGYFESDESDPVNRSVRRIRQRGKPLMVKQPACLYLNTPR